jgi:hypothetical protein
MRVVAYFDSLELLEHGAREANQAGWRTISVCSPAYNETVLAVGRPGRSPVAVASLAGGIVGLFFGLVLTVGTVRQWPGLIVSGKPLVSVPPFLIIMFELTILVASIGAAWSFLVASARARLAAREACDATTSDNRFALLLESAGPHIELSDAALQRLGAIEWRTA